jgi:hypothetical protein
MPSIMTIGSFLDVVLFPLTFSEILNSLEKNGYELSPAIPFPRPTGRFRGSGQIGRKGNISINIDGGEKSLIIAGTSLEDVRDEFHTLFKTILDDYAFNLDEIVKFYQYTATYRYKTKKNPFLTISKSCEYLKIKELSEIIGEPLKTFGIRFASADNIPNSEDWCDVKITPDIEKNDGYIFEIVYRNKNKDNYQTFISNIETNLMKVVSLLEG